MLNTTHWLVTHSATRHRSGARRTNCLVLNDEECVHRFEEGLEAVVTGQATFCHGSMVAASLWSRAYGVEVRLLHMRKEDVKTRNT